MVISSSFNELKSDEMKHIGTKKKSRKRRNVKLDNIELVGLNLSQEKDSFSEPLKHDSSESVSFLYFS